MTTNNFKILFLLVNNRKNKQNQNPIYCRITINGERKQFSTGINVEINHWDSKLKSVVKTHQLSKTFNAQLDSIKSKIYNIIIFFQHQDKPFNTDDVVNKYLGKEISKNENVVSYYLRYIERLNKLVGKEIKENTFQKFKYVSIQLADFIKWKFNKADIPIKDLNLQFLEDFDFYLKTEREQQQVTVNKTIQRFRAPIKQAISEGYLDRDPFILHKSKKVHKEVLFLTTEELNLLENKKIKQQRLLIVRDLFVFCCYSGLPYNEMSNLKKENISIGFDNSNWITMKRQKTQQQLSIPILPKAQVIIDTYSSESSQLIFPRISNQKFNSYIKEIAEIVGIKKKLTHHIARKTFASTVLLYNDVPMEIVSELLGHSKISTTQEFYAKVVNKKVSQAMLTLTDKLKK